MTKEKILLQKEIVFYSGKECYVQGDIKDVKSAMDEYAVQQMRRLLLSQPRWIPVEELRPGGGERVLLLTKSFYIDIGDLYDGKWRCNGKWKLNFDKEWESDYKFDDITHWMRLPELPT